MADIKNTLGLYLHIPFCRSKCIYCDFYSLPTKSDAEYKRYINSLILHMEDYSAAASNMLIDTIFIGGGTPSVIPTKNMIELINGAYHNFNVTSDAEITMEANPATIDRAAMKKYVGEGVTRFSFGLQSANDRELKALSRIHSFDEFVDTFNDARKAKCGNINVDIMFGLPGQTKESLMNTLRELTALDPEHISMYGLKIEEGTPIAEIADTMQLPEEDEEFEMYLMAIEYLDAHGYKQYEISNFAKTGYECKHNLKYWNCEPYLGLGPAAHSYFNGERFSFKRDAQTYMNALELLDPAADITDERYEVRDKDRMGEYIMLQFRLCSGLDTAKFKIRFGRDFEKMYSNALNVYIDNGFMTLRNGCYSFTPKGMYVSNYILAAMLDFDENKNDQINAGT